MKKLVLILTLSTVAISLSTEEKPWVYELELNHLKKEFEKVIENDRLWDMKLIPTYETHLRELPLGERDKLSLLFYKDHLYHEALFYIYLNAAIKNLEKLPPTAQNLSELQLLRSYFSQRNFYSTIEKIDKELTNKFDFTRPEYKDNYWNN